MNSSTLLTILGVRPNPLLLKAKPAWDNPETKGFREAQRKPHMRRAVVAFFSVFVITYIANAVLTGAPQALMTFVNIFAVGVLCFSTMANLLIRSGNWTLRLNPWAPCKARVLPFRIAGRPLVYLVEATSTGWDQTALCVVRKRFADHLVPTKKDVLLSAGLPGLPMAFAPKSGAPVLLARRFWPRFVRELMLRSALKAEAMQ